MNSIAWWLVGIVAAGGGSVIMGELGVRWWFRHQAAYYVWAPGYRRTLWPDREAIPAAEPIVRFEVNSAGERGDEPPRAGEAVYRILAAGGSAVECMLLDQDTSWPGMLQRLLGDAENRAALGVARVHVGNVGKSDVDSQALDRALRHILPRYRRLDTVIVLVGASDVMRWLAAGALAGTPAPDLSEGELFDWHPNGPFSLHPKRTALAELARRLRVRLPGRVEERKRAGKFMTRARAMRAQATPLRTVVPDPSPMLDAYDASLRNALRTAMRHSDRVILARQPWFDKAQYTPEEESQFWHGGLGDVFTQQVTEFCSSETLRQLMSEIDRRALRVAEELDLEHIDLRAAVESTLTNYYDLIHFTSAGAAKVAEAIASRILGTAVRPNPQVPSTFEHADGD